MIGLPNSAKRPIHIYIYIYVYIYVYIYIYVNIHIYIYVYRSMYVFGNPIMSEYVRIEFHCYIFVSMTNLACGGTGLISVFCCIWITNPA